MRARTIIAVAVPAVLVGAVAAGTSALAGMNVQEHRRSRQRRVREGAGSPGPQWDLVATHIETWYHPLPWIGKEVDGVSCPDLAAVKNTKITCTAKSGSTRVTVPVSVVEVAGGTAPRVTWKFGR